MNYGDVQAAWADMLWGSLAANGVRHVVVSPGSRSTPLVLGLERSELISHVVIDERSAGFFALGAARARREPVALVCTSGTAGAHYLPAVIEAKEAGHPLIVVTADRPPELQGLGASQTTDQTRFFGSHALIATTLGLPSAERAEIAACASLIARAAGVARSEQGPVHLNVPMRKPFEPSDTWVAEAWDAPVSHASAMRPSDDAVAILAAEIDEAAAGWVIVGSAALDDEAAEAVRRLCASSGFLLLCEPGSNMRDGVAETRSGAPFRRADGFELALAGLTSTADVVPDVVLQLGPGLIARSLNQLLELHRSQFTHLIVAEHGWPDPTRTATHLVLGKIGETVTRVTERLTAEPEQDVRADLLIDLCESAWEGALAALLAGDDRPSGPGVCRAIAASLPDGGFFFVGNSRPIRDVSQFCDALPQSVGVLTQRGVAGIDGNISGVLGVAATSSVPITALIGDIAFLHDSSALLSSTLAKVPAVIVVVDNGGGRIFEELPIAETAGVERDTFERYWLTPHGATILSIAAAFGAATASCQTLSDLTREVRAAHQRDGVTVVHVAVDPALSAEIRANALNAEPADRNE